MWLACLMTQRGATEAQIVLSDVTEQGASEVWRGTLGLSLLKLFLLHTQRNKSQRATAARLLNHTRKTSTSQHASGSSEFQTRALDSETREVVGTYRGSGETVSLLALALLSREPCPAPPSDMGQGLG